MELDDCAFPLLQPDRHHRRPQAGLRRRQRRPAGRRPPARPGHGALRPARGQRRHLQAAGRSDQRRRRRRHQGAGGRQPGQHQLPDRDVQRARRPARALHRDDAPRPQPGDRPARQQARQAGLRGHQHDHLGQPLRHPVPGPGQRQGRRRQRLGRRSTTRPGSPTSSSRGSPSAAPRSSTPAAPPAPPPPPTRRSTTSTTGCSARRRATGSRWRVPADGSYGIGEGIICGVPCTCSGGEWSVVQGLEIPDFSRERIDASVMELQEERDAVSELGLI